MVVAWPSTTGSVRANVAAGTMYMSKLRADKAEEEAIDGDATIVGEIKGKADAEIDGETDAEANANSAADADTDTDSDSDSDADADADAEDDRVLIDSDVDIVATTKGGTVLAGNGIVVDVAANDINNEVVFIPLDVLSTIAKVLALLKAV